ncbi:hypothetical protein D3C81_1860640 [compost metagenome]
MTPHFVLELSRPGGTAVICPGNAGRKRVAVLVDSNDTVHRGAEGTEHNLFGSYAAFRHNLLHGLQYGIKNLLRILFSYRRAWRVQGIFIRCRSNNPSVLFK